MRLNEFSTLKVLKETKDKTITLVWNEILQCSFVKKQYRKYAKKEVYHILQTYHHPNIVKVYEVFELENEFVVIEEYVNGILMSECMQETSLHQKLQWFYEICDGLQTLHKHHIVYRDIKPENIMIIRNQAVLFDFDIAKQLYEYNGKTTMIGTVGYAAPEQYGFLKTDERSDIYALGILLNMCIVGKHPKDEIAIQPYDRIIKKCTALDPTQRYQCVEEIVLQLRQPHKKSKRKLDWIDALIGVLCLVVLCTFDTNNPVPVYEFWIIRICICISLLYMIGIRYGYIPSFLKKMIAYIPFWLHWIVYGIWWGFCFLCCMVIGAILSISIADIIR